VDARAGVAGRDRGFSGRPSSGNARCTTTFSSPSSTPKPTAR
jgi:hypothetical protein